MLAADGRVIMISGANRGIGLAVAKCLATKGYRLSLSARDLPVLAAAIEGLDGDIMQHFWEATEPASAEQWVSATAQRFGRIDGVVANAGMLLPARLESAEDATYDQMWEVNFKGPMRLIRAAMPHLRQSGQGRVINLVSLSGKRLLGEDLGYAASKFASLALTHAVRHAGWADGVRASAVCPGLVETDMTADRQTPDGQFKISPQTIAESVAYLLTLPNSAVVAELLINSRLETTL